LLRSDNQPPPGSPPLGRRTQRRSWHSLIQFSHNRVAVRWRRTRSLHGNHQRAASSDKIPGGRKSMLALYANGLDASGPVIPPSTSSIVNHLVATYCGSLNFLRYSGCYERGLTASHTLAGKLELKCCICELCPDPTPFQCLRQPLISVSYHHVPVGFRSEPCFFAIIAPFLSGATFVARLFGSLGALGEGAIGLATSAGDL